MAVANASGNLTSTAREFLSKLLGVPSEFELLYSSPRDGMVAGDVSSRIINQGPTVIVCWGEDDKIFGGHTTVNWIDNGKLQYDRKCFLFRLGNENNLQQSKYPIIQSNEAIQIDGDGKLVFGRGPDVKIEFPADKELGISCECNLGHSFQKGAQPLSTVTKVKVLEVYRVLEAKMLTSPWREEITETKIALKKSIEDYVPVYQELVKEARILLAGAVGAGKSSFFNTINSIFRGQVSSQAIAGSAEHSLTTNFRAYLVRNGTSHLKFRLCDTRGMEDTDSIHPNDFDAILDGHVPDMYTFNPATPITSGTLGYIKAPTLNDQIHCVAFVIDSSTIDVMSESIVEKFQVVRTRANQRGIPQVILLTKVDQVALEVEQNLSELVYSSKVAYVVDQVAQLIGVPRNQVLPVKNYEKETKLNDKIDKFALTSLQRILGYADDFMYGKLDYVA